MQHGLRGTNYSGSYWQQEFVVFCFLSYSSGNWIKTLHNPILIKISYLACQRPSTRFPGFHINDTTVYIRIKFSLCQKYTVLKSYQKTFWNTNIYFHYKNQPHWKRISNVTQANVQIKMHNKIVQIKFSTLSASSQCAEIQISSLQTEQRNVQL